MVLAFMVWQAGAVVYSHDIKFAAAEIPKLAMSVTISPSALLSACGTRLPHLPTASLACCRSRSALISRSVLVITALIVWPALTCDKRSSILVQIHHYNSHNEPPSCNGGSACGIVSVRGVGV
jgi:hypothetical protein